jgi:hypothetical protein
MCYAKPDEQQELWLLTAGECIKHALGSTGADSSSEFGWSKKKISGLMAGLTNQPLVAGLNAGAPLLATEKPSLENAGVEVVCGP